MLDWKQACNQDLGLQAVQSEHSKQLGFTPSRLTSIVYFCLTARVHCLHRLSRVRTESAKYFFNSKSAEITKVKWKPKAKWVANLSTCSLNPNENEAVLLAEMVKQYLVPTLCLE
ncbi:uncharacterized protein LOC119765955 [Culex quinquefasciatus]|uniref:uncharacterized protein LOC119765955 n=1 Tax=Culex quinquefasciatus TaxID=7176 RepID=UPI0018E2E23E|nr:uncharacterized protein LOC119765955 [Culex quinquefasciatus]